MPDRSFLDWPFFDQSHRDLARDIDDWAEANVETILHDTSDLDARCRNLAAALGEAGFCRHAVIAPHGGVNPALDVRSLCLIRETLARYDGLADFAFGMQGLGTGSISLFGSEETKAEFLPPVARGESLAAFALTEPKAGSDAAALTTTARLDGDDYVINGEKTWISNGGIAGHYVVFARTGEAEGARGISAIVVPADTPGLEVVERIDVIAPHPLAWLRMTDCRVPKANLLGESGSGFKIAMATLDIFRSTVGAAALGLARRALDDAIDHSVKRDISGTPLAELQLTQGALADMATAIDAAALLIYRAAWTKDSGAARISREASMAKMYATEAAQKVIDQALQLHGGNGVRVGTKVEELYREIRALRIYEGATEVQKVVIARQVIGARAGQA